MQTLIFEETPYEIVKEGLQRKIIHTNNLMSVLIDFTDGPWDEPDPFHSHPHEQTTYVAEGEVIFFCESQQKGIPLKAGDMVAIPGGVKHCIQILSKSARLIDNFTPVREDFLKR